MWHLFLTADIAAAANVPGTDAIPICDTIVVCSAVASVHSTSTVSTVAVSSIYFLAVDCPAGASDVDVVAINCLERLVGLLTFKNG